MQKRRALSARVVFISVDVGMTQEVRVTAREVGR